MPLKEIHEDFIETFRRESPFYSSVKKKRAAVLKKMRERELSMMDGLAAPKMPPLMKMSRSCTPWLYVIRDEAFEA